MNPKQIEAVMGLPAPKRYDHFIKTAADREAVWGLFSDGWALAETDDGNPAFPLWPAEEYAALCSVDAWVEFSPKEIDMEELLEDLLPDLEGNGTAVAVFPTPTGKGIIPEISLFESDLRNELSRYE